MDTAMAAMTERKLVLTWPERWMPSLPVKILGVMLLSTVAGAAHAQLVRVDPSVQFRLTYTDNVRADRDEERSAFVGQVTPGLGLTTTRTGGRVQGRLNTRLGGALRSRDSGSRGGSGSASLELQGNAQVEAIDELLFVDFDAGVRRSNLSLFEGRADDDFLTTDRGSETRTYSIAPRLEFRMGSVAQGRVRYLSRWFDSGGRAVGTQRLGRLDAGLENSSAFGPLGWGLDYSRIETSYRDRGVEDAIQEIARVTLFYRVTSQLRVRGSVGYERNDFGASRVDNERIVGAGADWFPTPRTTISGFVEDRFFGSGYNLSVNHRRARSIWLLTHARDVRSSIERFGSVFQDPFFVALFDDPSYVERFPDPLEREDAIRRELGLTGDSFVTNAFFVARILRAAVSLVGVRNTLTLSAQRTERSRLSGLGGLRVGDEFRDTDTVRTRALGASWRHRLSGSSSLNASLTHSRAERDTATADEIRRWLASFGVSKRLSPKAVVALVYRFQNARGANEFRENVISATLGLRF